ncbi:TonB-dependent receptor domain-containing protein [Terriglobus sp.]|uniref:TonB-dependent receptor n=1 Tax=Terriglobus sp. TaxID=1889013 RepID=UPI003AFF7AEC
MTRYTRLSHHAVLTTAAIVLSLTPVAAAQSYYGTLKGLVKDPSGAAVPNAEVRIVDEATKVERKTTTTGAGEYVFNAVDPGTFTIRVVQEGFQKYENMHVVVQTQQTVAIDVPLTLGSSNTVVEVTSAEPVIDTSTAQNGQVFDTQKLVDLPNLGRNPYLLTKLNNNVTATGDPRFNRFQDQSGSSAISIAGGPVNMNNYLIDGVPVTDFSNRATIIPSVEAVQEMKTQANTYDAEAGRTGGGVFNTLLKSGTNTLHGNLYGSTRQTNWSANTWLNNHNHVGRPTITQYSYEGSIGGPIWKDRAWFIATEEGYRQRSPLGSNYFLPSDAERSGNFAGSGITIYDPATTDPVTGNRQPFANNLIPTNRINPVGAKLLAGLPVCGAGCNNNVRYGAVNFQPTDLLGDRADEFISKVDLQVTKWWLANASYLHYGSKEPGGNPLGSFAGGTTAYLLYRKVDDFNQNNVITLNPTTILTVSYGQNRFPNNTLDLTTNYDQAANLGFPTSYANALQKKAFPAITMQTAASFGTNNSGPAVFYSRSAVASVAKSLGRHSIKAGYNFRTISVDFTNVSTGNGSYTFQNTFSSLNANPASGSPVGGADLADLLLGYPTSGSVQVVTPLALNVKYNAVYVQDDIRVNDRLTVNAGLRYELEPGIHERNNHYAVGFDQGVANPISSTSGVQTKGAIEFAGQNGYKDHCCDNGVLKFGPRAGFAYAVNPKMVVRGGYGVFYAPIYYSTSASLAPGYAQTNTYVASNDSNKTPATAAGIANPFPNGLAQPSGNSAGLAQGIGTSLTTIDQNRRNPIIQQYSFDIQQELGSGVSFEMGYVGAHGRNLLPSNGGTYNIDQVNPAAIPYGVGACPANSANLSPAAFLTAKSANPYAGRGGTGVIGAATVSNAQLCRPFPQFSAVAIQPSTSKSNYNSLILNARKRYGKGFSLTTGYTWSKNMDSQFSQGSSLNVGAANGPQDVYNINGPGGEYSLAINDIPHRFTFGGSWDLPFGKGRQYLNTSNWMDLLIGGYQANMTFVAQDGGPVPLQSNANQNSSALGTAVQRPNLVAGVPLCTAGSVQGRLSSYFNPAAFAAVQPGVGQFGNAPRTDGACRAPGMRNADASVFKEFQFERVHFRFQAEALNVFNTPLFALNSNGLKYGNSQFGTVNTSAINFPRLISLGGRISF